MIDFRQLRTIKQLAAESPAFSEGALRWVVFNAKANGLDEAIVRHGRKVLIDLPRFNDWLSRTAGQPLARRPRAAQGDRQDPQAA